MEQFFVEPSPPPAPFIVQSMTLSGRKWDDTIPSGSTAQMHIPRRSLESENGSPSRGSAYRNATEEPPKPPDRKSLRTKNIPAIEPVQDYVNSDAILQAQQGKFPQRCTPSANLANPSSVVIQRVLSLSSCNFITEIKSYTRGRECCPMSSLFLQIPAGIKCTGTSRTRAENQRRRWRISFAGS